MIDIVMTSPAEFENISKAMNTENEDERKSSEEGNEEEMEEGEIFDDDDNKGKILSLIFIIIIEHSFIWAINFISAITLVEAL